MIHALDLLFNVSYAIKAVKECGDGIQVEYSFKENDKEINETSIWRNGTRNGWCQQQVMKNHRFIIETAYYKDGARQGCCLQRDGNNFVIIDNNAHIKVNQDPLGVLFTSSNSNYFAFRDGYRKISDANGVNFHYRNMLENEGARKSFCITHTKQFHQSWSLI